MIKPGKAIPVTKDMIPVGSDDLRPGMLLLVMNDMGMVSEHVFRGKLVRDSKFSVYNPKTDDWDWVTVEPDHSYREYLLSMKYLFKSGRLMKYKSTL